MNPSEKSEINTPKPTPTPQQLWTSYTREQCCHIDYMQEKMQNQITDVTDIDSVDDSVTDVGLNSETNNAELIIDSAIESNILERQKKIKRQLEEEGAELTRNLAPVILHSAILKNTSEKKDNATSAAAGDLLLNFMKDGANRFEKEVGRPMTYSEIRELWG